MADDYDAFTEYVIRLLKGIQLRKNETFEKPGDFHHPQKDDGLF
ncbi:MAG: hypothetical protein ACQEQO_05955 [Thermodesulfobacteriota bacterium]